MGIKTGVYGGAIEATFTWLPPRCYTIRGESVPLEACLTRMVDKSAQRINGVSNGVALSRVAHQPALLRLLLASP